MIAEIPETAPDSSGQGERNAEPAAPGRLLCFPAHDEADEIAAAMLAQLLEHAGRATVSFPAGSSMKSTLDLMEQILA